MKLKILWAALCCLLPLSAHAALYGLFQVPVPGPVPLTSVTASPTTLSTLVKGSYLYAASSGPGGQVATFTVSGTWAATLHAYVVGVDGNTLTLADNLVYNLASGSYGAVASGTDGTFFVNVPSGGFVLVQTALTTSPTASVVMGPGVLFAPGGVFSVQGVGGTPVPVSANSLPLPTGAATSTNQTNGNALSQIVDGSTLTPVDTGGTIPRATGTSPSLTGLATISGGYWQSKSLTGSQSNNAVIWTQDCTGYSTLAFVPSAFGTSVTGMEVQGSNDNANWTQLNIYPDGYAVSPIPIGEISTTTNKLYTVPIRYRYYEITLNTAQTASTSTVLTNLSAVPTTGLYNFSSPAAAAFGGYTYSHLSTTGTTEIKSSAGTLHSITINTSGLSSDIITVYDNTAGSGTVIAAINGDGGPTTLVYDVAFSTGLTVVIATGTAADITVAYK